MDIGLALFLFVLGALWWRQVKLTEKNDEEARRRGERPPDVMDMDHWS